MVFQESRCGSGGANSASRCNLRCGGQNAILSPYSVSAALTMLDVGARGETGTQVQSDQGGSITRLAKRAVIRYQILSESTAN